MHPFRVRPIRTNFHSIGRLFFLAIDTHGLFKIGPVIFIPVTYGINAEIVRAFAGNLFVLSSTSASSRSLRFAGGFICAI